MPAIALVRYGVFAIFVAGAGVSLAAWAVRTRQVSPFSALGRFLRGVSEPFIRPMEGLLVRRGGNPQNAGWWIFGITVVGGILVVSVATWLVGALASAAAVTSGRGAFHLVVYYAGQLIMLALLVRVIASWFGAFQYNRWIRPAYLLTDWFIVPLQKIIPPIGGFDLTPLVAWIVLRWVLSII